MSTTRLIAVQLVVLLLAGRLPIQGALVSGSDPRFGPDSLTLDTSTGLAWLDLPVTAGFSYDAMSAALGPDGEFAGFRFATAHEVAALFRSAGIPGTGWFPESSQGFQAVADLIVLLGPTSSQDGHPEAAGISGTWGQSGLIRPILDLVGHDGVPGYDVSGYPTPTWEFGETTPASSWLVTAIPEPTPGSVAGLAGLLFLAARRLYPKR